MGRSLGKYKLLRELGRGGMGVVYLAEDTHLQRQIALKVLTAPLVECDEFLETFRQEARTVASLTHPNIIHVNAFEVVEGQFVIDMTYAPNGTFRDELRNGISLGRLAAVLEDTFRALACCHEKGIIHRDIKPSNLLVDADRQIKLSDFGIAHLLATQWQAGIRERTTFSVVGTPEYIAPEILQGQQASPQSDLYAAGMIAREALVAELPFRSDSPYSLIQSIASDPIPPLTPDSHGISPLLADLTNRLVARDPAARPSSAEAALKLLRETPEHIRRLPVDSPTRPLRPANGEARTRGRSPHSRGPRFPRRPQNVWIAAALVTVFALGVTALNLPEPVAAPRAERDSVAVPRATAATQADLFASSFGSEADVLARNKRRILGDVYVLFADTNKATQEYCILYDSQDRMEIYLIGPRRVAYFLFDDESTNESTSGIWAAQESDLPEAARWGRGTAVISKAALDAQFFRLDVAFESETDLGDWSETLTGIRTARSDTEILAEFETASASSSRLAMQLLTRLTLWPALPEFESLRAAIAALFPALTDSFAAVPLHRTQREGSLNELIRTLPWSAPLPARPLSADASLRFSATPERLVVDVAGRFPSHFELSLAFGLEEQNPADSLSYSVNVQGLDIPHAPIDWTHSLERADAKSRLILFVPWTDIATSDEPLLGSAIRINIQLRSITTSGDDEILAVWGWPDPTKTNHGLIAYLAPHENP